MRASEVGQHLLAQGVSTWDERELGFCERSGDIYWLAQLLRSWRFENVDVPIDRGTATLPELAVSLSETLHLPLELREQHILARGLAQLREASGTQINLGEVYKKHVTFPAPLS